MKTTRILKCLSVALVAMNVCAAYAQANATLDRLREKREQVAAPANIKEIFALAKKSAEEDFNVNFCGFFTGMSRYDAMELAAYYKLKEGEYSFDAVPGKAVSKIWFSTKGVRRITRGGNTLDELAQAVGNQVGNMRRNFDSREWEYKTIDGIAVTFGMKGLTIQNNQAASLSPTATEAAARKESAAAEAAVRKEQAASEAVARGEQTRTEVVRRIIEDMVGIPGKEFKMGKYEVTQKQWSAIMGANPSYFKCEENPVENVSWNNCKKFLEKLNALPEVKESGLTFRLPTAVEWEYACRAGATGDYCRLADGTAITPDTLGKVAWYIGNSEGRVHPIGQKEPNAFGLYDMHGNVWEWCEDLYRAGDYSRVHRGGGWGDSFMNCRASDRSHFSPDYRNFDLGFRLVASQN